MLIESVLKRGTHPWNIKFKHVFRGLQLLFRELAKKKSLTVKLIRSETSVWYVVRPLYESCSETSVWEYQFSVPTLVDQFQIEHQESLGFLLGTGHYLWRGWYRRGMLCWWQFCWSNHWKVKKFLPNFKYHLKNRYPLLSIKNTRIKLSDVTYGKLVRPWKAFYRLTSGWWKMNIWQSLNPSKLYLYLKISKPIGLT
jgi:hypothetical protein